MRVVCDNCGASYKIPEAKLTKEVNKATCRKCGHAIYIRKAVAPADVGEGSAGSENQQEERTLITSSADLQGRGARTGGFEDMAPRTSDESTIPRGDEGRSQNLGRGSPSLTIVPPDNHPASPPTLSPATSHSFSPAPVGVNGAPDVPHSRQDRPAYVPKQVQAPERGRSPTEPTREMHRPEPVAPERSMDRAPRLPDPPRPVSPAADRPEPARMPAMAPSHDPRGDLTLALLTSLLALFGITILLANAFIGSVYVVGAGAFFALLGSFATVFVLLTSGRGTRQASWAVSLVGGFLLAAAGAGGAAAIGSVLPDLGIGATSTAAPAKPTPTPAPATAVVTTPPTTTPAAVTTAPVVAPPPTAPPATTPAPATVAAVSTPTTSSSGSTKSTTSSSKSTTSSSGSSKSTSSKSTGEASEERITPTTSSSATSTKTSVSSSPSSTSTSSGSGSSGSTTATKSTAAAATATGVSPTVIDTMMKSNKAVKSCFITEKNESGTLPANVKVQLTIQPTGKVSSASIPSGDYAGTSFDSCLSGAVKSISFPPFEGSPAKITYPFVL